MSNSCTMKRKNVILLIFAVAVYMLIIVGVVHLYGNKDISVTTKKLLQNGVYLLFLIMSLILMKCTKKSFTYFGISFTKLPLQILIGIAIGLGLNLFMLLFGSVPSVPNEFVYIVFSQLLVGISEETFWRGFVLHVIWDTWDSKDKAVLFSSLLFGLSHFPIGGSIAQVFAAFIIGAFLAVLRTEFKENIGIPALAIGHAISNIF